MLTVLTWLTSPRAGVRPRVHQGRPCGPRGLRRRVQKRLRDCGGRIRARSSPGGRPLTPRRRPLSSKRRFLCLWLLGQLSGARVTPGGEKLSGFPLAEMCTVDAGPGPSVEPLRGAKRSCFGGRGLEPLRQGDLIQFPMLAVGSVGRGELRLCRQGNSDTFSSTGSEA